MIYVWIGALIFHREVNKEVVSVCESLCESYYRNDKLSAFCIRKLPKYIINRKAVSVLIANIIVRVYIDGLRKF